MVLSDTSFEMNSCAMCGKGDGDGLHLKTCTACKTTQYCGVACQKAHRPLHRTACKKRSAELHDEALFLTHPRRDDCPICFLPLQFGKGRTVVQLCCGKVICYGCMHKMHEGLPCPYCKAFKFTSRDQFFDQIHRRIALEDDEAMNLLGCVYEEGTTVPSDLKKAFDLWSRAAELGNVAAHYNLAGLHLDGRGVDKDAEKATRLLELAAMGGHEASRHNLGGLEWNAGNRRRAMRHFVIAAEGGCDSSLEHVRRGYSMDIVSKDRYEIALRAHKDSRDEVISENRSIAEGMLTLAGAVGRPYQ